MKGSPECGETKPESAFGRNRTLADGLSFYCLACNRRRSSAWYRRSRAAQGRVVRDLSWVPEGFRWCPACQQAVAHADFSRNARSSSGFGSTCRACKRRSSAEAYWRRQYGMSRSEVDTLRRAQSDRCAICGDPGPEHLDHDHSSGKVRSLLCQRCNFGLGLYRDDPRLLRAAAEYVERHRDARSDRPRPCERRRPQVTGRAGTPPVGSGRRPPVIRRTGLCSRGRAFLAAREADA